jgi:hypothetical protein
MEGARTHSPEVSRSMNKFSVILDIRAPQVLRLFWRGLREWCGDAAYERYSKALATKNSAGRKLSQAEFYVDQLNRKYSRPNRCC